MQFTKMHGLGNDYIYLNCLDQTVEQPEQLGPIYVRSLTDEPAEIAVQKAIFQNPNALEHEPVAEDTNEPSAPDTAIPIQELPAETQPSPSVIEDVSISDQSNNFNEEKVSDS